MQLIDALDKRSDSVRLVESVKDYEANCDDEGGWWLILDGAAYSITDDAFDALLNILRIPIKYVKRCVEEEGNDLAERSVNYWMEKYGDLSFLVAKLKKPIGGADYSITQVFPGRRLYLPGVQVNDLIVDYYKGSVDIHSFVVNDDVFNATYLTHEKVVIDDHEVTLGVSVLYSDCFNITPRFDGVLVASTGATLGWPTIGRKFRVASNTIPQVVDQIEEFLDLSISGLKNTLIPALSEFGEYHNTLIDAEKFFARLCNDLRLSKRVRDELIQQCTQYPNHMPSELVWNTAEYLADSVNWDNINVGMARDLQIALSFYVVSEDFKG